MTDPAQDFSFSIRPMQFSDLNSTVEIHREQFPESRSTNLGKPFLYKMYRWFVSNQPTLVFVAERTNQVTGFVTGAIGGYGRKIFRYGMVEIIFGLLVHPKMLFNHSTFSLWSSYLKGFFPLKFRSSSTSARKEQEISASLSSIAVAESSQGLGIGQALVLAFEEGAIQSGATLVGLSVKANNLSARRLYEKCGWRVLEEQSTLESVYYIKKFHEN
jgi:ribosomal protein S18 acetylase RimI-like enzyme